MTSAPVIALALSGARYRMTSAISPGCAARQQAGLAKFDEELAAVGHLLIKEDAGDDLARPHRVDANPVFAGFGGQHARALRHRALGRGASGNGGQRHPAGIQAHIHDRAVPGRNHHA
ncbi:hypothetical protein CS8_080020 [Cupriavidus sp. 8B]